MGSELEIRSDKDESLFLPANITLEQWWRYRLQLKEMREWQKRLKRREAFHTIDWILTGEELFGERASQGLAFAQDELGWTKSTFERYRNVAVQYPPEKRREGLSIHHYKVVEALPPKTSDALLDEASEKKWTVNQLTAAAQTEKKTEKKKVVSKQEIIDAARSVLNDAKPNFETYELGPYHLQHLADLLEEELIPLEVPQQEPLAGLEDPT